MAYLFENYIYSNFFELLDENFPNNNITTIGSLKEEMNLNKKLSAIIREMDDDMFFDKKLNNVFTQEQLFKLYNVRIATQNDYELFYGF